MTTQSRRIHIVGIGGVSMSALAQISLARGDLVTGSELCYTPKLDLLRQLGARIRMEHDPAAVSDVDVVVASSAIPPDNVELVAAGQRGVPVVKRDRWLPELTGSYQLLAVAGTHGKTTTTALLAMVLDDAKRDPTAVIGSDVPQLGGNALAGGGPYFVLEADEYDGAFDRLKPYMAIITNVEYEHPDYFPDEAAVRRSFAAFASRVDGDGRLVVCGDDPGARAVAAALGQDRAPVTSYGLADGCRWRAEDLRPNSLGGTDFTVAHDGTRLEAVRLRVPGRHNVRNALAVLAVAHHLGIPVSDTRATLERFTGAARRFQLVGQVDGVTVVDDYAHHPTEVRATLQAARQRHGDRPIWVIFQPHTFSRLAVLLEQFATAFESADRVYVTDIYGGRETRSWGVAAEDLVGRIVGPPAFHSSTEELLRALPEELPATALVLTLGAGDITMFGSRLIEALRAGRNG